MGGHRGLIRDVRVAQTVFGTGDIVVDNLWSGLQHHLFLRLFQKPLRWPHDSYYLWTREFCYTYVPSLCLRCHSSAPAVIMAVYVNISCLGIVLMAAEMPQARITIGNGRLWSVICCKALESGFRFISTYWNTIVYQMVSSFKCSSNSRNLYISENISLDCYADWSICADTFISW